ncbi:MAG: DUF423 domain-containing protein [Chitinophagaceae bacterium]|nr:MAG: DUF423 domain-containing protein [Chitinophagaceae bacterium]
MHKGFLKVALVIGALSVMFGAFGAHALKDIVSQRVTVTFETAVRYQFYHVFALLAVAMLYKDFNRAWLRAAGYCIIAGFILFCGSLYLLCYAQAIVSPGFKWVGPITPLGGMAFIAGWCSMLVAVLRSKSGAGAAV